MRSSRSVGLVRRLAIQLERAIDHVEASPHAKAREPFLDGTSHAKLDRLSLGPRSCSTFGQTRVSMS